MALTEKGRITKDLRGSAGVHVAKGRHGNVKTLVVFRGTGVLLFLYLFLLFLFLTTFGI